MLMGTENPKLQNIYAQKLKATQTQHERWSSNYKRKQRKTLNKTRPKQLR